MNDQSDLQRAMKAVDEETKSDPPMARPTLPVVNMDELEKNLQIDEREPTLAELIEQLRDTQSRHAKEITNHLLAITTKINSIKSNI